VEIVGVEMKMDTINPEQLCAQIQRMRVIENVPDQSPVVPELENAEAIFIKQREELAQKTVRQFHINQEAADNYQVRWIPFSFGKNTILREELATILTNHFYSKFVTQSEHSDEVFVDVNHIPYELLPKSYQEEHFNAAFAALRVVMNDPLGSIYLLSSRVHRELSKQDKLRGEKKYRGVYFSLNKQSKKFYETLILSAQQVLQVAGLLRDSKKKIPGPAIDRLSITIPEQKSENEAQVA
jgi:hypothetical protein